MQCLYKDLKNLIARPNFSDIKKTFKSKDLVKKKCYLSNIEMICNYRFNVFDINKRYVFYINLKYMCTSSSHHGLTYSSFQFNLFGVVILLHFCVVEFV
jgi:hypothetical protein